MNMKPETSREMMLANRAFLAINAMTMYAMTANADNLTLRATKYGMICFIYFFLFFIMPRPVFVRKILNTVFA